MSHNEIPEDIKSSAIFQAMDSCPEIKALFEERQNMLESVAEKSVAIFKKIQEVIPDDAQEELKQVMPALVSTDVDQIKGTIGILMLDQLVPDWEERAKAAMVERMLQMIQRAAEGEEERPLRTAGTLH